MPSIALEPMRKRAEGFSFLEGPVWHHEREALIFSDIPASRIHRFDPATEQVEIHRDATNKANGNAFDREHRLISCEHVTSSVVREEHDGSITVLAHEYDGCELNSPNDVIVDRDGRVLFTDPPYGRTVEWAGVLRPPGQPVQGVYRVDPSDRSITLLVDDFEEPNGLCLSLDETTLFVNDSARKHIRRFDLRGDDVSGGEVWAEVNGNGAGSPDGMKVDSEGNLYCSGPGGIHVFGEAGQRLGVVPVPEFVGNFNWGDPDLRTLYVCATTALYSARMGVSGIDTWRHREERTWRSLIPRR